MNPHEYLQLPLVEADLVLLEEKLAQSVLFGDPYLDQVTTHLIYAGGKRLRPLLAVASATGGERSATNDDLMGGIALELMHLASLYHDDVMDEALVRRNVDSVNARYGNLIAIVAGDYLMALSAAIAADLGTQVASLLAHTLASLTRGQVSEVRTAFRPIAPKPITTKRLRERPPHSWPHLVASEQLPRVAVKMRSRPSRPLVVALA